MGGGVGGFFFGGPVGAVAGGIAAGIIAFKTIKTNKLDEYIRNGNGWNNNRFENTIKSFFLSLSNNLLKRN
jgi:hypothetical protein